MTDSPEEYVRQNIEKAIVRQYHYNPDDCEPEFRIQLASSKKRVDIAVFKLGSEHIQKNIYIIVETKKAGTNPNDKDNGIEQLKTYMAACVNTRFGLWTNGEDRFCYARRVIDGEIDFEEIVDFPLLGQSESDTYEPERKALMPATEDNLLFAFKRCHNYIAGTEGTQKPEAFWELLKIIFCKIEDERSGKNLRFFVKPEELKNSIASGTAKVRIQKLFTDAVVKKYPSYFCCPRSRDWVEVECGGLCRFTNPEILVT